MSQRCGLPSTTEPGVFPAFGLDKRGRARLLAAVPRPPTGNSYSVLGRLAEEARWAAGQHHADEGGAEPADDSGQQPAEVKGGARAKKKNKRQRMLQRKRHGGVPARRASTTGWWCIATGSVILFVLLLAYGVPAAGIRRSTTRGNLQA